MPWKDRQKQTEYYREWYRKNGRKRAANYAQVIALWIRSHPEVRKIELTVYCGNCKSRGSWKRTTTKDIYSEDGKLLWQAWTCTTCGHGTLRQVKEEAICQVND